MTRDATTAFARTLVDEWVRHGVTDACLAPGSRSAPLALALAGDERVRVHVFLDERSASFFALGVARATGRPAPLLCTSGTAAANFHPAVLEAHHGRVPMIVCTADRPPELRDTGAGQTVDQVKLYGDAVRWFHEAEPARRSTRCRCRVARAGVAGGGRGARAACRAGAPRTCRSASRSCRPGDDAGRRARPLRRPPVDRARAGRAGTVGRDARRARAPRGRPAPGPRRRRLGCRRPARDRAALRRGRRLAGARRPALEPARARHRSSAYDPLLARPGFAGAHRPDVVLRVGAPDHQQGRRCSGSTRPSTRCWSIPTTPGSTRCTRRAVAWSPTPSSSSARSPTRST